MAKIKDKKPPVTSPPVTSPPPVPAGKLGSWGNASIDHWDGAFIAGVAAVKKKKGVSVNPLVMKGIMDVETGGDGTYPPDRCRPHDSFDNVPACGPMQIKYAFHKARCPECDFTTVPGQIELATHIIGDTMKERGGDEYDALTAPGGYFPADDPGHSTQNQYVAHVKDLVAKMGGTTPAKPEQDVLALIYGGKPFSISATYGQLVTWSCPNCYTYFTAYGLDSNHHWAWDVSADAGEGAPLYAPFDGKIVCAGTDNGPGAWGTGCAAFPRTNNYGGVPSGAGAGRLEILNADGTASLILGHVLSSRVKPGDLVSQGDRIGQQGGMNASHVHVEGRYANGTRIGDPRKLFGGGVSYADPVEISQPDDAPPYAVYRTIRQTAVRQRGSPTSPEIWAPLLAGTEFYVQHKVLGSDGKWWLVGRFLGRVAEADAEFVKNVLS